MRGTGSHRSTAMNDRSDPNLAAIVTTSQGDYRVVVGRGVVDTIGAEMKRTGLAGRAFLIADRALFPDTARLAQEALESGGYETHLLAIPPGEQAKSLDNASRIYDWLGERRAERGDVVVAMGGGVTGDLAGFAAATWLRGVAFVQLPTTLAAMVDASIGGKVAVNLTHGKNLVGAFHQPRLVLSDVDYLDTLPKRELAAGWAEAIKHGLILDHALLETLEREAAGMMTLKGEAAVSAIRRSVAVKAEVVAQDEFETGAARILLNYGHTVGHALEAITGYGEYLHGEAVSVGMMAAAGIATRLDMIGADLVERQQAVLTSYGLPVKAPGASVDDIIDATRSDKKSRGGSVRWVLLESAGKATVRQDVPEEIVREAIAEVVAA